MRLKLSLLLVFIITYSWSQSGSTKTFTGNGTFSVPAGVTSLNVQAWGGGGSGGGASGAPLLLGRGAAGGGGGGYASNTILVTSGTTLNVVVASQTTGTSGAGVAGGNSTITGFESSILAAGGSGGGANNAGGSPVGGVGGTIAASAGSIKFAGANGGNGNSWNLLGLLLSSGPGGAGAGLGGAGGTAVSGLILSNGPGNAGSPPGGAGSGAINSALGASQIGGAGAAGRVIISYNCANFSLTSTNATSICASAGTTSSVTLTGSAASLPVGTYIVTYDRSSPAATDLTANLTVSTAGTGTFIATGLTTAGSSTISITKLTSESCSSNITTNNTATVTVSAATVAGTVNGGTTINSGSTSGLLTLSGHTGSVIKWQSSVSPFTTWTDIANTTTTYTSGTLTETTQFRAVVQNGAFCAALNSAPTTVTVNPRPTIALAPSAERRCRKIDNSSNETTLLYSATTQSPTTYSIVWDSSPTNSFVGVTDAALPASPILIAIPGGAVAGTYTGTLTVKNANGAVSSPGSAFSVIIDEAPTINIFGLTTPICTSSNSQNVSIDYTAVTGSPTSYSIDWNASANAALLADQATTPFNFVSDGGAINTVVIPANVPAGSYAGTITISNGVCSNSASIFIIITQTPSVAVIGAITPPTCEIPTGSAALSGLPFGSRGWKITTNPVTVTTSGSGTNTVISELAPGTYTFIVSNGDGFCPSFASESVTIPALPVTVGGTVSGGTTICSGNTSGVLTLSGHTGSIVKWQSSVSPFTTWTDIANTTTTYISGTLTETTQFRAVVQNGAFCTALNSDATTVTVNPSPTITFANSTTINTCYGKPIIYSLFFGELSGSPVTYSVAWDSSPANNLEPITDASLPEESIDLSIPAGLNVGTYTGTLTVKNGAGCVSLGTVITINVIENPEIISSGIISSVTASTTSQTASLPYSFVVSNPIKYSINWNQAANAAALVDQPNTLFGFSSAGGNIDTIQIPANVPAGTYVGRMSISNEFCSQTLQVTITINDSAPTITLTDPEIEVCYRPGLDKNVDLNYSATTGNPTTYSIVWDSSPSNIFEAVVDAALPSSPITIVVPVGTVSGTYTGTLTVKNAAGNVSLNAPFTIIASEAPSLTTAGFDELYTSNSAQNASLAYSASTGNPVSYSISWSPEAQAALLADQGITPFTFSTSGGAINNIVVPANVPAGLYSGVIHIYNEHCETDRIITLPIDNPAPTIVLSPTAADVCSDHETNYTQITSLSYSATTGSPTTYSIVWDASPANNFVPVVDQALPASPIIITVPGQTNPETYTGTLTVKDANDIVSLGSVFTLKVNQGLIITAPGFIPTIDPVNTSSSPQTTTLTYTSTIGSPTSYSIDWNPQANNALLADQPITPFVFASGGGFIDNIEIPANVLVGTYTGLLKIYNENCEYLRQVSITISEPAPTIALATSTENVCSNLGYNETSTTLSYTETTGEPVTYSIVWNSSPSNSFASVTNSVLPNSPITIIIPEGTIEGTYTGTLTVKNVNGVSSTGSNFSLNIGLTPEIIIYEPINPVCASANLQNAILPYFATESNPTSYYIDWDSTANAALLQDQSSTSVTLDHSGGTIDTVVISANAQPGSYSGTMYLVEGFCTGPVPVSIVINSNESCTSRQSQITVASSKGILSENNPISGTIDLESAEKVTSVTAFNQVIQVEAFDQIINQVFVYDVSGNLLYKKNAVSDSKLVISSLRSSNQVLVVKVVLNDNRIATKKVIY